ncbi:hypothetical protein AG1IA_03186 [Rhizoctonia solani AG-1 IA]|uniref:Uncharacterized protein n=1 Tax=Thanatephorus cucumeris (strain AG1-IA) TaxID=983506 RepID=L8X2F2_THACA|nr:hypothetical protein AG1IA_03186 [Rhizoctonia solani AG-1 IA]
MYSRVDRANTCKRGVSYFVEHVREVTSVRGVYYLPDATGPVFKAVMSAQGVLSVKLGYAFQAISKDLHQEVLSVA